MNDSSEHLGQPVLNQNKGMVAKYAMFDVFAFIPVPVYAPGKSSSSRSLCFSFILFFAMVGYAISTAYSFVFNNVPRTSQQLEAIDSKVFEMPNFAVTVIPDMSYGISLVDPSYYSIKISQGTLYKGLSQIRNETSLKVNSNCKPEWLPPMNFSSFICPAEKATLEGNLFTSDAFKFIKIDFLTCVPGADPSITCKTQKEIEDLLLTARIFLFIEQDKTFYKTAVNAFKALFYYAVPDLYQKYEIYLQSNRITTSPDYLKSFKEEKKQALFYHKEKTYVSSIQPSTPNNLITIWLRLNEEETLQKQQLTTLTDVLGKWGALWSVLLTTFGLYFIKHNKQKFYKRNPEWENFGTFVKGKRSSQDNSNNSGYVL